MKFRILVFIFVVLILLVGAFTKPGLDDFKTFYAKENGISSPPMIEHTDGISYSLFSVTAFAITTDASGKQKAVAAPKIKYLGLFGRFWKL
ncbi:MAG: hypothetical protein J7527_17410 [Chitinophagaceae bacterium]|nr:hypothetical protein [Chitinophagaceae bacterium]